MITFQFTIALIYKKKVLSKHFSSLKIFVCSAAIISATYKKALRPL